MQLALRSPVFRAFVVSGLLLAAAVGAWRAKPHHKPRLILHTYHQRGAIYLTAWRNGALEAPFDGDERPPLVYKTTATVSDGCRWQGIETLEPIAHGRYAYRYEERILACEPDAIPYYKTPRTGIVVVE